MPKGAYKMEGFSLIIWLLFMLTVKLTTIMPEAGMFVASNFSHLSKINSSDCSVNLWFFLEMASEAIKLALIEALRIHDQDD